MCDDGTEDCEEKIEVEIELEINDIDNLTKRIIVENEINDALKD